MLIFGLLEVFYDFLTMFLKFCKVLYLSKTLYTFTITLIPTGTTSRSMIQSNTNNSTTSVLRRKTDRMNTIQPQTRSAQIQNTNTLQTPTTYSQASSITNTYSNQDEGRTNQRFRINNEQMPFVNQQLETNNQQSSINTNQVIMHPTGEHSGLFKQKTDKCLLYSMLLK